MVARVELQWVKSLLSNLLAQVQVPPTLFSNNLGATYLSSNQVFHSRMKHLMIDYHFVHDVVQLSELRVVHVSSNNHLADLLLNLSLDLVCFLYVTRLVLFLVHHLEGAYK